MPADNVFNGLKITHIGAVDMACSWCEATVPLPEGDYSGVCIGCGTVMFRRSAFMDRAEGRQAFSSASGKDKGSVPASAF